MPLDYLLAYRACIWYMKIRLGLAGKALQDQQRRLFDPCSDVLWAETCFYKPAHDLISRLDPTLLTLYFLPVFRSRLRDLFFDELTMRWRDCTHAPLCHVIHPEWRPVEWTRLILSRRTCCSYHQIAVGRGKFGDRSKYSGRGGSSFCRFGCSTLETVHHLFFECSFCTADIVDMQLICRRKRLDYCLQTLFTHPSLQARVERFLRRIFDF